MVNQYLATRPDPATYDFLGYNLSELTDRFGGVVGTAFKSFPSYPQRYMQVLDPQPQPTLDVNCGGEPLKVARVQTRFTEDDLVMREFRAGASRRLVRTGKFRAAYAPRPWDGGSGWPSSNGTSERRPSAESSSSTSDRSRTFASCDPPDS